MVFGIATQANAAPVRADQFFNFDRAKSVWSSTKDLAALNDLAEPLDPGDEYKKWIKRYNENPNAAADEPIAKRMKELHDLWLTYNVWNEAYRMYLYARDGAGMSFNRVHTMLDCASIAMKAKLFTNDCNALPDWRKPESKLRDEELALKKRTQMKQNGTWKWGE
ncbi:hypothetical protein HH303_05535 [Rhodospirillaceae bacterium KN72]|uniref:Uncharacterized protein n=1 Tax=Pacificispira spongiicola TaxID=2729598 RepID=A0A7Y0HFI8_9PROT|nr:hypothetical protein [Pacificispira spongiicola]NMM43927.1 hypothetical protein [Pacificispira spongiicola]